MGVCAVHYLGPMWSVVSALTYRARARRCTSHWSIGRSVCFERYFLFVLQFIGSFVVCTVKTTFRKGRFREWRWQGVAFECCECIEWCESNQHLRSIRQMWRIVENILLSYTVPSASDIYFLTRRPSILAACRHYCLPSSWHYKAASCVRPSLSEPCASFMKGHRSRPWRHDELTRTAIFYCQYRRAAQPPGGVRAKLSIFTKTVRHRLVVIC